MTRLLPKWLKRLVSKKKLKQLQPLINQAILIEELHPIVSIELSSVWKGIADYVFWKPRMEWYFFPKYTFCFSPQTNIRKLAHGETDKYNTLRRQATVYKRFRKFKVKDDLYDIPYPI